MIRRLKKDVLDQLPEKRRQQVQIAVDDKILKELNKVRAGIKDLNSNLVDNKVYAAKPGQSFDEYIDEQED